MSLSRRPFPCCLHALATMSDPLACRNTLLFPLSHLRPFAPTGANLTYQWSFVGNNTFDLSGASTTTPFLMVPQPGATPNTTYVLQITVTQILVRFTNTTVMTLSLYLHLLKHQKKF